jgi:cell division transport system permease protein
MIRSASVLPLEKDASSRFLPWLIAFMVWLAAMALALVMALSSLDNKWRKGIADTVTVQIVPLPDDGAAAMSMRVAKAAQFLAASPGVKSVKAISRERVNALLEPWLGRAAITSALDLPIPRLIEVQLEAGADIDTSALGARLAEAVQGAQLDDHGLWLDRLITLTSAIEGIGYAVLSLIGIAAVVTVVFATRTGLAIHQNVIELMHVMGARDRFIARQFERHALMLGLKGGIAGFLLSAATLIMIGYLGAQIDSPLLPSFSLGIWQWAGIGSLALATVVISIVTARVTVLRALGRML